jgi:hypothetical protein
MEAAKMPTNKQAMQIIEAPNTKGRPLGSLNKRTILRQALQDAFDGGEAGFWQAVVEQAKAGDTQAMQMVAKRLMPELKTESQAIDLPALVAAPTLAGKAQAAIDAAGAGDIAPSAASDLVSAIASAARVVEITELQQRLEAIERQLQPKKEAKK